MLARYLVWARGDLAKFALDMQASYLVWARGVLAKVTLDIQVSYLVWARGVLARVAWSSLDCGYASRVKVWIHRKLNGWS